jgi:hypothetical protein
MEMIFLVKTEIERKLVFLEKKDKIDPKFLLEDVHHFSELLKNFTIKSKGTKVERYTDYYYEHEDCNYDDDYKYYCDEKDYGGKVGF